MKNIIEAKNISKKYIVGQNEINALKDVNFEIKEGEFTVILGPSGAGKTTLLNMLGGMDSISSGDLIVDGENISAYSQRELTNFRRNSIGFVFQFYN